MTNEQQFRLEILELRLAMAALERVAARQQQTIDLLRERAASESIERGNVLDAMMEMICNARYQNANVESIRS